MKKTFIYTLSDEKGIRYVGKSNNPEKRLKMHLKECKLKRTIKEKWIFSLKLSGESPKLEIIDEVNVDEWIFFEIYWISQLKSWGFNLLNGTSGGEGSDGFRGRKHSDKTKLIIKEKVKKQNFNLIKGEKNGFSKLTNKQADEIRNIKNISYKEIAKIYNVSKNTIGRIKRKETYAGVEESGRPRWAHNPKITGSNPVSASKLIILQL